MPRLVTTQDQDQLDNSVAILGMCTDQTIIKPCVTSLWLSATIHIYRYGSKSCNSKLYTVLIRSGIIEVSQPVCIGSSQVCLPTPSYTAAIMQWCSQTWFHQGLCPTINFPSHTVTSSARVTRLYNELDKQMLYSSHSTSTSVCILQQLIYQ